MENSLDAGATNIGADVSELWDNYPDFDSYCVEVRLKDHGLKSIEIVDNGTGIAPEDYDHVGRLVQLFVMECLSLRFSARKHYTSKLSSFDELSTVTTFGFRGEALSSLCALSERVTITTATSKEEPLGTILELDKTGVLMDRSKTIARKVSTSLILPSPSLHSSGRNNRLSRRFIQAPPRTTKRTRTQCEARIRQGTHPTQRVRIGAMREGEQGGSFGCYTPTRRRVCMFPAPLYSANEYPANARSSYAPMDIHPPNHRYRLCGALSKSTPSSS